MGLKITEAEYMANEDYKLMEFAKVIRDSGISIYEIAKGTGLSWETVKAAASAVPVNGTNARRIEFYLNKVRNECDKTTAC